MLDLTDKKLRIRKSLKAYRLNNQLTLKQLESKCGVDHSTLSLIELGRSMPSDLTAIKIIKNLPGLFDAA